MKSSQSADPFHLNVIVDEFDRQWRSGNLPEIDCFLEKCQAHQSIRAQLLVELIAVDLEYRWKPISANVTTGASKRTPEPWFLEKYLEKWPELGSVNQPPFELISEEYRVRKRWGHSPTHDDYRKRFPQYQERLEKELAAVDANLSQEQYKSSPDQEVPLTRSENSSQKGQGDETFPHFPGDLKLPQLQNYLIQEKLGTGGMAVVYKARQLSPSRIVAIKFIKSGDEADQELQDRFLQEANMVAQINNPGIVQIHDAGLKDGFPYYVMEYVEGGSLASRLQGQPQKETIAVRWVEALARGMAEVHRLGIIHRDLKPQNVLVDAKENSPPESWRLKIADFGLAKQMNSTQGMTETGQRMGTPEYMSPEQAAGKKKDIGPTTDVYALGTILYQLLLGHTPFKGASFADVMLLILHKEPIPPRKVQPKLSRDVETICLKCLEKDPQRRYPTAEELADDLQRLQEGKPILARRVSWFTRRLRVLQKHRLVTSVVALLVVAIAGVVFLSVWAFRFSHLVGLEDRVTAHLNRNEFSAESLQAFDQLVLDIKEWDPELAMDLPNKMNVRLFDTGKEILKKGRLVDSDYKQIKDLIQLLSPRNKELARALKESYLVRLQQFEEVLHLVGPDYAELKSAFGDLSRWIQREGNFLVLGFNHRRYPKTGFLAPKTKIVVPLEVTCQGNVRLEAKYTASWEKVCEIGLILNGDNKDRIKGYQFILRPLVSSENSDYRVTFAETRKLGGVVALEIWRNGNPLGKTSIPMEQIAPGTLRLEAQRLEGKLTFQVNQLSPFQFNDIFPLNKTGHFGLIVPEKKLGLVQLRAERQGVAAKPSPLEEGNQLYLDGQYANALRFFRKQAIASLGTEEELEARVKEAMCLSALKRDDEAGDILEAVATQQEESRWSLFALAELLGVRVRQRKIGEVDTILDDLISRRGFGKFEEFAFLIPDEVVIQLMNQYEENSQGGNFLLYDANRIKKLERLNVLEDAFHARFFRNRYHNQIGLLRAYRIQDQLSKAVIKCEEWLRKEPLNSVNGLILAMEYGWIMREQGTPETALAEVNKRLYESPGVYREDLHWLLVERARLHIALGNKVEAENDLRTFFAKTNFHSLSFPITPYVTTQYLGQGAIYNWVGPVGIVSNPYPYSGQILVGKLPPVNVVHLDACMLLGFLRAEKGDTVEALAAWNAAAKDFKDYQGGTRGIFNLAIAASLTGKMSEGKAKDLLKLVLKRVAGSPKLQMGIRLLNPSASVFQKAWLHSIQNDFAREWIYQSVSFREATLIPVQTLGLEYIRQNAFQNKMTPNQEKYFVQTAFGEMVNALTQNKLTTKQAGRLAFSWNGVTGNFGWAGVKNSLSPKLRAPIAYVLGHRYQQLKRKKDAVMFLRTAVKDSPANSELRALAIEDLSRLEMK